MQALEIIEELGVEPAAIIEEAAVEQEEAVQALEVIEEHGVEPAAVIEEAAVEKEEAVQALEIIEELGVEPAAVIGEGAVEEEAVQEALEREKALRKAEERAALEKELAAVIEEGREIIVVLPFDNLSQEIDAATKIMPALKQQLKDRGLYVVDEDEIDDFSCSVWKCRENNWRCV